MSVPHLTEADRVAIQRENLFIALEHAVPLHIFELCDRTPEQLSAIAQRCAGEIGSRGDVLLFGSTRRGEVAEVFTHLARGLAAGAYAPGGIRYGDHHWCVDHSVCAAGVETRIPA